MSLRSHGVEQSVTLPDGRKLIVRVSVPDDGYVPKRLSNTVGVELWNGHSVLAAVNTVLSPNQESEALQLARELKQALEEGLIPPTASAIEPYADQLR